VTRPVRLVVTDLDGTLWDRTNRVHPTTLAAIDTLHREDVVVLAATARRPASARYLLEANGLRLPAVLLDGALGRDLRDGSEFHRHAFPATAARVVLDAFTTFGVEPCVTVASASEVDAYLGPHPSTHPDHARFIEAWSRRADLVEVVATHDVLSFGVCGAPLESIRPIAEAVASTGTAAITADLQYGGHSINVAPIGIDKWRGVEAFCGHRDIDPACVLAIGDGENDLGLLARASIACSVEGGCPGAVALAHHVLGRPQDGGWAQLLDLVL
jgi:hypothetical protein